MQTHMRTHTHASVLPHAKPSGSSLSDGALELSPGSLPRVEAASSTPREDGVFSTSVPASAKPSLTARR
jgi:hypothetical protein